MRVSADNCAVQTLTGEQFLRCCDVQQINQLIEGCRDRGDDCAVWMRFFIRRLEVLFGAESSLTGQFETSGTSAEALFAWTRHFVVPSLVDRDLLEDCNGVGQAPDVVVRHARRPLTAGDRLTGLAAIHTDPKLQQIVVLTRSPRQPRFNSFDAALLSYALERIAPSVGRSLAEFREPRPSDLPPRVRQVLVNMLSGEGAKQTAAKLGISVHTVNQYVRRLFAFYGVNGRAELLARWIARGWKPHLIRNED